MGWGYGINSEGREIGYDVSATCDHPDCNEEIHRGLAYVCGDMHDASDNSCGRYFCEKHLIHTGIGQFCQECYDKLEICSGMERCRGKKFESNDKDCQACLEDAQDGMNECLKDINEEDSLPTLPWCFP